MPSLLYDVAILGAGPAGATLARLLGGKMRVLLVDRRPLDRDPAPGQPIKSCGGLVAPDAQQAIAQFGLGLPDSVLVGPQLFAVRTIDLPSRQERFYQRFYINVDRERLDRWLAGLATHAEPRFGCVARGVERIGTGADAHYAIHLRQDGRDIVEHARLVVGADGAESLVRRLLAPQGPAPRRYAAIQRWFEARDPQPFFSALFDPAVTDFYAWCIPKGDRLLVGAALPPGRDAHARFDRLLAELPAFGYDLSHPASPGRPEGCSLLRPLSPHDVRLGQAAPHESGVLRAHDDGGEGGLALVGEAAGFVSPSSAEGFSYAYRSALALSRALAPGLDGWLPRYRAATADLRANLAGKRLKTPVMYQPALRRLALRSGLKSLEIHEDC